MSLGGIDAKYSKACCYCEIKKRKHYELQVQIRGRRFCEKEAVNFIFKIILMQYLLLGSGSLGYPDQI